MNDWNTALIEEFRANDGKVGGQFEGAPLLILHTTGAKSGQERLAPVMYQAVGDGDAVAVFASKAGAPTHPDWYHNLLADPSATVEVGGETYPVKARVADGDERERDLERRRRSLMPGFADYEPKTFARDPGGRARARRMTAATPAIAVVRNDDKSRYEIFVDGQVARLCRLPDARRPPGVSCTPRIAPEFHGRDLAATLVGAALDDARARGYRVIPAAPYVAEFIEDHPEYADLVGADTGS